MSTYTTASPPRLAVITPNLQGGGCERIVAALLPELVARYRAELILHERAVTYPLPADLPVLDLGLDTSADHSAAFKAWRVARRLLALRRQLRAGRYDLLLSFIDLNNAFVHFANRWSGHAAPLIAVEQTVCPEFFRHNPYARRKLVAMRSVLGYVYRRADRVVALSHSMASYLRREFRVSRPIEVIYNGIDTGRFRPLTPADAASTSSLGLDQRFLDAKVRLLSVGRLEPHQKNQPFLVRLLPRLLESCPDARLFFIGSGDGACELRNLIHAVRLDERAFLLGWTDKPAEYLRRAALLLHAARYETFGNVLVESLACGTPVVVTDCGQVLAEVLSGGRYGSIVPQDDADAYVAATREALRRSQADPAWRQGLSEYARSTFDLALTRQRYLALVEQEAARRGLGPRPNPA